VIQDYKLSAERITFSKIRGAKGNIEFWVYLRKKTGGQSAGVKSFPVIKKTGLNYDKIVSDIVQKAHKFFK
jgi:hypothetical protein